MPTDMPLDPNDPEVQRIQGAGEGGSTTGGGLFQPSVVSAPDSPIMSSQRISPPHHPTGPSQPVSSLSVSPPPHGSIPSNLPHDVSPLSATGSDHGKGSVSSAGGGYFPQVPTFTSGGPEPSLPTAPPDEPMSSPPPPAAEPPTSPPFGFPQSGPPPPQDMAHSFYQQQPSLPQQPTSMSPSLPQIPTSPPQSNPQFHQQQPPQQPSPQFPSNPLFRPQQQPPPPSQHQHQHQQTPRQQPLNPPPNFSPYQPPQPPTQPPVVPQYSQPAPPPRSVYDPPPAGSKVTEEAMISAQKHAKWAVSALNFEDVPTAIKELRIALRELGAG